MSAPFMSMGGNAQALFSLKLHRGESMVLLAMNWRQGQPPKNFVGWYISYKEPGGVKFFDVSNRLGFAEADGSAAGGKKASTKVAPIQKFRWVHFPWHAELAGTFTYRVEPVFMDEQDQLSYGDAQEALIDLGLDTYENERKDQRQRLARPLWQELRRWLELERRLVADGAATAKAIDYTLGHWTALTRHLEDGAVALDNNHLERQIKPWAMGRKAWQFVGSELAGQRAAIVMSLVQSARMNGHDPWAYLRDVLQRLPTQLNSRIEELLPHRWMSCSV